MHVAEESLTHKFVRRGSWLYLLSFIAGPLAYAIKITISHDLSVSDIGLLYGVLSLTLLLWGINDFGMVESLNYFIPKQLAEKNYIKAKANIIYAAGAMVGMSVFISAFLYFISHFLWISYFKHPEAANLIQIFIIFLCVANFHHFATTIFSIYQNTKLQKGMEVIRYLATLGFVIQVFVSDTGGLLSYAWTWNWGVIIAAILGCILAWKLHLQGLFSIAPFVYKRADLLELIQYSSWSMLAINATALLSQIDLQLLLLMRGTEEVGYYSNYISIFSIPFLFVMPIVGFMFPVVSAYFGANRLAEIRIIVTTFTRIFLTLSIPISGILLIYGSDLGTYFFGEKFARSGHILLFSAPFIVFNFLLQLNFVILGATGKIKERLRIVLIGIGVNLLLNIIFIYLYGAEWSALAVGLSWIVLWGLSHRVTGVHRGFLSLSWILTAGVILSIAVIAVFLIVPRELADLGRWQYTLSVGLSSLFLMGVYGGIHYKELRQIYTSIIRKT